MICGSYEPAIPTACAIEMLHSQSLIHDDLPCMDNDDYRRGKLTNHKVFGESTAVLAGDALLSFAPQVIIQKTDKKTDPRILLKVLEEFVVNAGAEKLIAGQVVDIDSEGKQIDKQTLNYIHENKTGSTVQAVIEEQVQYLAMRMIQNLRHLLNMQKNSGWLFRLWMTFWTLLPRSRNSVKLPEKMHRKVKLLM